MPILPTKADRAEREEVHPWPKASADVFGGRRHREGPEMVVLGKQVTHEGRRQFGGLRRLREIEKNRPAACFRAQRLDRCIVRGNGVDLRERKAPPKRVLMY